MPIVPYDSIIIGAGPAGITAAIYLARKKLDLLVISMDVGGQAQLSTDIENYPGFTMIPGEALAERFQEHLEEYNIKVVMDKVTAVKKEGELFSVKTTKDVYWAKTVIIACGKKPRSLHVPGEEKFIGKGITYCATYDAPSFKGKPVAVIGAGNSGLQAVLLLSKFTKDIYLVTIGKITGDETLKEKVKKLPVKIFTHSKVIAIEGRKRVEKIKIQNLISKEVTELPVAGVIVEIGLESSLDFEIPEGLGLNEKREIVVDKNGCTTIPGIFAAGDVTDVKGKQIVIAAGSGASAALSAYNYLMKSKKFIDGKF